MSNFREVNKKIERAVVAGYTAIEDRVVSSYKKIENGVVSSYQKIEDKFVDTFLTPDGEGSNGNHGDSSEKRGEDKDYEGKDQR